MLLGLDYAGGRPGGKAIAAAGYRFVVRYLTSGGEGLPGKLLTPAEYADLQAHGIAVVANWETTANRMLGGRTAGVTDAESAGMRCLALGHPTDRPIYFSADWDARPDEQALIDDYLRGAASVIGPERVGVYGGYWVIKRCLDNHTARWAWQTGAWSGGNRDPRIHLYQRIGYVRVGGVECDENQALATDFGQHPQGDDMPSPAEIWAHPIEDPYVGPDGKKTGPKPASVYLAYGAANAAYAAELGRATRSEVAELRAEVAAIKSQLSQLPNMVGEEVRTAFEEGIVDVEVTVRDKTGAST